MWQQEQTHLSSPLKLFPPSHSKMRTQGGVNPPPASPPSQVFSTNRQVSLFRPC
jgi:hypothetical protein